jgi:hypothetical protein
LFWAGDNGSPATILALKDMNLDGLQEMVVYIGPAGLGSISGVQIIGWNGVALQSLITQTEFWGLYILDGARAGWIFMNGLGKNTHSFMDNWIIQDIDQNGTWELIVNGGLAIRGDDLEHGPYRAETDIYMWNGTGFALHSMDLDPPQYRFQAVQDGDRYVLFGQYDKALDLYQQAIFSDKLDWWSPERSEYDRDLFDALYSGQATPALPAPGLNEYPNLAAYARYRIMLLHIVRGWLPEAKTVYDTLQLKFQEWEEGHAYAEMAAAFWTEYQASQDIGQACNKAVEYATANTELTLTYIGSDYHGWQSHYYKPIDVCPFK